MPLAGKRLRIAGGDPAGAGSKRFVMAKEAHFSLQEYLQRSSLLGHVRATRLKYAALALVLQLAA